MLMCPDCYVPLTDGVPSGLSSAVTPDDSWVVVGGLADKKETETAQQSLDSNNIPSVVTPSSFHGTSQRPLVSGSRRGAAGEGSLIMVPREFEDEAVLILSAVLGDDFVERETR
jgi:hypothetical protein